MQRKPPDILITTPESLFLILTSQAHEMLRTVRFLILDEVHLSWTRASNPAVKARKSLFEVPRGPRAQG